jgi:Ca2+-transporting ATPase
MRVRGVVLRSEGEAVWIPESEAEGQCDEHDKQMRQIQKVAVLCNNASIHELSKTGDPLEIALLDAFISYNNDNKDWLGRYTRLREEPFDSNIKMMAVWVQTEDGVEVCVKGAPGVVLDHCEGLSDFDRSEWDKRIAEEASKGFRLLGLAIRSSNENLDINSENPYQSLHFLGLILLSDPPRKDVRDAILSCKSAGIRVVMLTGDQPETAAYVAKEVGLIPSGEGVLAMHGNDLPELEEMEAIPSKMEELMETSVFARITPRQKLDLIQFYQNRGEVVAMTGDGVNDAPALKKADIGISMGLRGTQVAMDASDMILRDDAFQTIVHAVKQGRIIFQNIRRFILFLLSCNVSEIVLVASTTSYGFLLTPLQILFLNLVTDVFPALALGMSRGEKGIMEQEPRDPKEPLITPYHWGEIVGYGISIAVFAGLSAFLAVEIAGASQSQIVTILFFTLAFAQLVHVVNMRSRKSGFLRNEVTRNFWVWVAVSICLVILAVIYLFPQVQSVLEIERLGWATWGIIAGCSLMIALIGHVWLWLSKRGWD